MSTLVRINSRKNGQSSEATDSATTTPSLSRRKFLQYVGSASAATSLIGCTDDNRQKALPNVKGDINQVPGVAVWYRSTCTECSAGCSITARNREGRTVKLEGSPDNPINRGKLCALGQSSLQALYDPDRVRQAVKRSDAGGSRSSFAPTEIAPVFSEVAKQLKAAKGKATFVTGELSGSIQSLVKDFCSAFDVKHVVYDPTQPVGLAEASKHVFGSYGVPDYRIDEADFVLNLGADFLETWVSPAEYSRWWAKSRRKKIPTRYMHLESRLSATAANADEFMTIQSGTESLLLRYLLSQFAGSGKLSADAASKIAQRVGSVSPDATAKALGIEREDLALIESRLRSAKKPLVIVGGAAALSSNSVSLGVLANFLNLALGAVGQTVKLNRMRKPSSSFADLMSAIEQMDAEGEEIERIFGSGTAEEKASLKYGVVLFDSSNPVFTAPSSSRLRYAMKRSKRLRVSFSSFMDETTKECDYCLPSSHSLESWGDAMPVSGVASLIQPTMKPVFDTQSLGDMLLAIAKAGGVTLDKTAASFQEYVRDRWQELFKTHQSNGGSFDSWFRERLETGGWFAEGEDSSVTRYAIQSAAYDHLTSDAEFASSGDSKDGFHFYPFFSVKGQSGAAANRGWMQELPDPITTIVWDSWVELHPDTAKKIGVTKKDMLTIRNDNGELNVPVYVSKHVHPGVLAVPIGQGHSDYGRFAQVLKDRGNPFELIESKGVTSSFLPINSSIVSARKAKAASDVVATQGSDSQQKRPILQTDFIDAKGKKVDKSYKYHDYPNAKDMYEQRKHPLYEWGMVVDQSVCTGCSACVVACYAENNIAVVGKEVCGQGREMSWLRIDRYLDGPDKQPVTGFQPYMCQHCNNAPCEPVCPVYATYHNDEGMNVMVYNRCVGTRYCGNNCSYKVRRFNWYDYEFPTPLDWQLNPDVTKRTAGVMEKCTFCVQRVNEAKDRAKDRGRQVADGEATPACVQTCPTDALVFGNLRDKKSQVSELASSDRAYKILDYHLNTQPSVSYLRNRRYKVS